MLGTYWIGGMILEIESDYAYIHEYCSGFQTTNKVEKTIALKPEDIILEKKWSDSWKKDNENLPPATPEMLEMLAIHRKICEYAVSRNTLMIHGSSVAVSGEGYIFTAVSGTGKSTHTRLWRELLGMRAEMVDDDKPMIHVEEDGAASVNGTPWNGKHHLGGPISVPLKAICILERSKENRIREISRYEAMPILMQQIYRPITREGLDRALSCINRMNIKYYRLGCNMDIQAARVSYEAMSGKFVDRDSNE